MSNSQSSLLKTSRFAPLFFTQFLGAFNDNLFKNALVILITFNSALLPSGLSDSIAVNICAGIFILPFFIFSALAGEIADKYEKSSLIQILKITEIIIVICGVLGLFLQNIYIMWLTLFLLGAQSAFFGPLKYSILPQHLNKDELVGGNALVESGTFIAILLGTLLGGILIQFQLGWLYVAVGCLMVGILGYISSRYIPKASAADPNLVVSYNLIRQSAKILKLAFSNKTILIAILGISWFWFLGATLLAQFPALVKNIIGSNQSVVTLLLAVFSIGIGVGSLLCEKISHHKESSKLIILGSIGLTIFSIDLFFTVSSFEFLTNSNFQYFISQPQSWRLLFDLFLLSIFGGVFIVPLYVLLQTKSDEQIRSRMIAANNIMNSAFMVVSAIFAVILFHFGFDIPALIFSLIGLNILVTITLLLLKLKKHI